MALNKIIYTDYVTVIGATNLNEIQDEIIADEIKLETVETKLYNMEYTVATDAEIEALFENI